LGFRNPWGPREFWNPKDLWERDGTKNNENPWRPDKPKIFVFF
jgi:hypothetical protein